ncbi:hypothetical protein T484DRAFT_2641955 [Baffinella frigidus]|nr:hypothetical protein T484DRAFT_2641955 [Cryptophyta sp. CCMP2293]
MVHGPEWLFVSGEQVVLKAEDDLDLEAFNEWVMATLSARGEKILRFKGIVAMQGFEEEFVVQGMHMLFTGDKGKPWRPGAPRRSRAGGGVQSMHRVQLGGRSCWRGEAAQE